jgi:hypothetical protein
LSLSVSKRAAEKDRELRELYGCFFDTFFPTFLLFFLSLCLFSSVCPITVFNGSALDSFTGGALDSFTGGALVCSTLLGTVEKQLRYLLKGKKIPISKYKSKKTQFKVSSDFSSQSSSESSSDSNLSVESISLKKEKKKRTFLLFFLSLFLFTSVCPITVFNGGALDSFTGGALDSLMGGALVCSTLLCTFLGIAPCCKYSSRNSRKEK